MKPLILLAEDEAALAGMLRYNLEAEGYEVAEAGDGETALKLASERRPDLCILDWMLPALSGVEVCRQLRRRDELREVPVLMLTARDEESDKVHAFTLGADDYMTKPFSLRELAARVHGLLRRSRVGRRRETLMAGDIEMDLTGRRVLRDGRYIHLGPTEFRLLRHFMESPGCAFTRQDLLSSVWGTGIHVELRTIDVHIRRLRKALTEVGGDPIRTVRGVGYALEVAPLPTE
ncbi:response regulator [Telmatospirillum sp. J64-1]|uniref:response regulator n=1 Tax=Telmatospirillum sp. J64-1 TaxID=2502183 RepID=UPI00115E30BF|nr:response regulator [Telmatospirillum sp. J64-1]